MIFNIFYEIMIFIECISQNNKFHAFCNVFMSFYNYRIYVVYAMWITWNFTGLPRVPSYIRSRTFSYLIIFYFFVNAYLHICKYATKECKLKHTYKYRNTRARYGQRSTASCELIDGLSGTCTPPLHDAVLQWSR